MRLHGRKHAAYRDDAGHVTCVPPSARLCTVWSAGTQPITSGIGPAGSRFHATGAVLRGLAEALLSPSTLPRFRHDWAHLHAADPYARSLHAPHAVGCWRRFALSLTRCHASTLAEL